MAERVEESGITQRRRRARLIPRTAIPVKMHTDQLEVGHHSFLAVRPTFGQCVRRVVHLARRHPSGEMATTETQNSLETCSRTTYCSGAQRIALNPNCSQADTRHPLPCVACGRTME